MMAIQVHFLVFFWCFLAVCNCSAPLLTNDWALATWLSMSSNCSPWASTSTAMSRNTWCNSCRFFSISFTASCLSCISLIVSRILPLPCSCMAFCRNVSLSPAFMFNFLITTSFRFALNHTRMTDSNIKESVHITFLGKIIYSPPPLILYRTCLTRFD